MLNELQHLGYTVARNFLSSTEVQEFDEEIAWWIKQFVDLPNLDVRSGGSLSSIELLGLLDTADRSVVRFVRQSLAGIGLLGRIRRKIFDDWAGSSFSLCSESLVFSLPSEDWTLRFWHQEAYADPRITHLFHLPLVPTNAENGGLRVATGGPWNTLAPHEEIAIGVRGKKLNNQALFERDHIQLDLDSGDLAVLESLTPHAGGVNRSSKARLFVAIRANASGGSIGSPGACGAQLSAADGSTAGSRR